MSTSSVVEMRWSLASRLEWAFNLMKKMLVAVVMAMLLNSTAWARTKSDIVTLNNGDRITGEIKQLERGKLRVSTDRMGEVFVEWDDIVYVESEYEFQFERTDGTRVVGRIGPTDEQAKIVVLAEGETVSFKHDNVVRISQIENSFWSRVNGSANFGYSFTKASDVAQLNLAFRASYRTEKRSFSIDGSTITTDDQANEFTQRSDLRMNTTRFRRNRWFNAYLLGFESNDELGLNLRSSLGASLGRYIVQTNTSELALLGGLVGSSEALANDVSSQENIEGLLGLEYSKYSFDNPTIDLSIRLSVYPSITDTGRTRAQVDASVRRELISNLFWDLSFYETYDSDPPSGSESTTDYGVVTSLGWSF
jgi:uncharacterized protein DUF481